MPHPSENALWKLFSFIALCNDFWATYKGRPHLQAVSCVTKAVSPKLCPTCSRKKNVLSVQQESLGGLVTTVMSKFKGVWGKLDRKLAHGSLVSQDITGYWFASIDSAPEKGVAGPGRDFTLPLVIFRQNTSSCFRLSFPSSHCLDSRSFN